MTDPLDKLKQWREITDQATKGDWVVGEHDHIQGASHCECLPEYGPLVWEGERDINGTIMPTHIHRRDEGWWDDDTSIYSTGLPDPGVVALSTTEYAAILPENARFIATAKSEMVPALLTAVQAVLDLANSQAALGEEAVIDALHTGKDVVPQLAIASFMVSQAEQVREMIRDALGGAQ